MKKSLIKNRGITLIALVVTIVILLILAGVSIAMLTGENGILNQARKAKENTDQAAKNEMAGLNSIEDYINEYTGTGNGYSKAKGVNAPKLVTGMHEVMFKLSEGNNKGEVIEKGQAGFDENNWYNYEESKWANARTQDGSYWVWIPRYAYKITYKNSSNKSEGGSIDVKFLVGTTDQYYDEQGNLQTAKRATSATEIVDTTKDYYVHPAFTDESKINFANGGWDKELTGIWVAKFEAGFASGNNNAPVKASSVRYTQPTTLVSPTEAGMPENTTKEARNWLDGIYGENMPKIKYPTFQPKTYSINYITANDAYNISKILTEDNNIYGLTEITTDSHLIKSSEWGAVVYLGYSQYGSKGIEPYVNNINLNSGGKQRTEIKGKSGTDSAYAVTGVTTGTTNASQKITSKEIINNTIGNSSNQEVYTWEQLEGQKASSTLNMYGVYDMNGGVWERTSGYIANGNNALKTYGSSIAYNEDQLKTTSTRYTIAYPFNKDTDNTNIPWTDGLIEKASTGNYQANNIYGDGIRETSMQGTGLTAWNEDGSEYIRLDGAFMVRSGEYNYGAHAGVFHFYFTDGNAYYDQGFRTVLVAL